MHNIYIDMYVYMYTYIYLYYVYQYFKHFTAHLFVITIKNIKTFTKKKYIYINTPGIFLSELLSNNH